MAFHAVRRRTSRAPRGKDHRHRKRRSPAVRCGRQELVNSMYSSWANREYEISTDPARIDLSVVHEFLSQSYWSQGVPVEVVQRGIENSICFGIYRGIQQIGFARVITDRATFAYLADVFVLKSHRGLGLSKWLMELITAHPHLQALHRVIV